MIKRIAKTTGLAAVPTMLLLACTAPSARADAIDGEWCRENRHFQINGPEIVTPDGNRLTGDYTRHTFRYTVPATAPGAGGRIVMQLLSETTLELFRGEGDRGASAPTGSGETWNRCRVTS